LADTNSMEYRMIEEPGILCPIDFSEPSRGALRYAVAIGTRFKAPVTVLTVNDPLLVAAADMAVGEGRLAADARIELEKFFLDTCGGTPPGVSVGFTVTAGVAAKEILRLSRDGGTRLIVMSSHGATGIRKMFFGSTTERVLRETSAAVLVTPATDHGPARFEDAAARIRRVLVPVDLSEALEEQVRVASGLAESIGAGLLLVHIVEPVRTFVPGHIYAANVDNERRDRAESRLQALVETLPATLHAEALVMFGDPAEEIAKVASDRQTGLIVIGLHASALLGARMGSVTYRVISIAQAHTLVLALPPRPEIAR
jgi:nucleotide-binding universal stress UspA family protein